MRYIRNKPFSIAVVLALSACLSIWFTAHANAQNPQKIEYIASGMFGIAGGQTARLSAVTAGITQNVPVELILLNGAGEVLARQAHIAAPGRAVAMDLRYPAGVSGNFPVRAIVRWPTQTTGYVLYSIQVIDDVTGRDSVVWINIDG